MYDDDHDDDGRFRGRRRRRPSGRARVRDLQEGQETDPGLALLRERGVVGEVVRELASGKEADVVLAEGRDGPLALKIYRDPDAGGFRPDAIYLDGRRLPRGRLRKVLDRGARSGLSTDLALWVLHEVTTLWALHGAGVPVPLPAVGPGAREILEAGRVVPMAFLGDAGGVPAPRLSDAELTDDEAADAWRQTVEAATGMLRAGFVHGDLSTWNLLWHEGRVVVIDVPQAVRIDASRHAAELLARDARSLADSVRPWGLEVDAEALERELRRGAGLPERGPLTL